MRKNRLAWYEVMGWVVNFLMTAMASVFIWYSYQGQEWRVLWTSLGITLLAIGSWTWILLFYGREKSGCTGKR